MGLRINKDGLDVMMEDEANQSEEEIEWDKALDRSINYSNKKLEIGTRRSGRGKPKKFENLSLECIIEKLIDNEEEYTEAAATLNKVWAPFSYAEKIKKEFNDAQSEKEIADALITLEQGYSNPMSFRRLEEYNLRNLELEGETQKDENGVIIVNNKIIEGDMVFYRNNRKIKKFWLSDTLKETWKEYVSTIEDGSISSLFLSVCIFLDQAEVYIEKLAAKAEKKVRDNKSSRSRQSKGTAERNERKRKAGFYKEDSSNDDSESEQKSKNKRKKLKDDESDFDEESIDDDDDEDMKELSEEEDESDQDSKWDSDCYI